MIIRWVTFGTFCLCYASWCIANTSSHSNSDIIEAIHAAKSNKLNHAKVLFEKIRREGNKSPKLLYNLGVIYYKLAMYKDAKTLFLQLSKINQFSELAYYNLALIEIKLNNDKKAVAWLNIVIEDSNYQKMHSMASSLMHKIKKQTSYTLLSRREAKANLFSTIPFSKKMKSKVNIKTEFGYNDNIALFRYIKKDVEKSFGDNFMFLQIESKINVNRHINIEASSSYMAYREKTYFNSVNIFTTANYMNRIFSWNYEIDGGYTRQNSNGNDYQQSFNFGASLFKIMFKDIQYNTKISNSIVNILDNTYKHLGGMRYRWTHRLDYYQKRQIYSFSYQNEINNLKDFTSNDGTSFVSFSARIHRASFSISTKTKKLLKIKFFLGTEYLYHSKNNIIFGEELVRRTDFEIHYGLSVTYQIKKQTKFSTNYRYSVNKSTLSAYRYQNSLYQFGIIWSY